MRWLPNQTWLLKGIVLISIPVFLLCLLGLMPARFSSSLNSLNKHLYDVIGDPIVDFCWFQNIRSDVSDTLRYSYNSACLINKEKLEIKLAQGLPDWARAQIQSDLSPFKIFHRSDLDRYATDDHLLNILARFRIEKGKVSIILPVLPPNSAKTDIKQKEKFYNLYKGFQHQPRFKVIYNMLKFMAKNGYIADTDFIVGVEDFISNPNAKIFPMFAFAKSLDIPNESNLILMPDWLNLSSSMHSRALIKRANQHYPWKDKKDLIFWRGGIYDSTGFRHKAVDLSKRHPDLMDAAFVEQGASDKFVSPADHLKYRYLLSIDGVRCSWERLIWQLHSNSLVFKHDSDQVQWFYKGIKPYVHYVPIRDEGDLFEKQRWAESHPKEVQSIIKEANIFAEQNLSLEDMYHYLIVLLQEYNKRLKP